MLFLALITLPFAARLEALADVTRPVRVAAEAAAR
jgi:hypothetical protein